MLALAIISTIFLGLLAFLYVSLGYDALKKREKNQIILANIIAVINVFAIVVTWVLYIK